jgi:hypothetical protein
MDGKAIKGLFAIAILLVGGLLWINYNLAQSVNSLPEKVIDLIEKNYESKKSIKLKVERNQILKETDLMLYHHYSSLGNQFTIISIFLAVLIAGYGILQYFNLSNLKKEMEDLKKETKKDIDTQMQKIDDKYIEETSKVDAKIDDFNHDFKHFIGLETAKQTCIKCLDMGLEDKVAQSFKSFHEISDSIRNENLKSLINNNLYFAIIFFFGKSEYKITKEIHSILKQYATKYISNDYTKFSFFRVISINMGDYEEQLRLSLELLNLQNTVQNLGLVLSSHNSFHKDFEKEKDLLLKWETVIKSESDKSDILKVIDKMKYLENENEHKEELKTIINNIIL